MADKTNSPSKFRRWTQWRLRWLLLLFVPLAIELAFYSHWYRQSAAGSAAFSAMCDKGINAHYYNHGGCSIYFKNGNVVDADLDRFAPALGDYSPRGIPRISLLRLNGSAVSDAAVARLQQAYPECEIER